jgi:hypothetical protein
MNVVRYQTRNSRRTWAVLLLLFVFFGGLFLDSAFGDFFLGDHALPNAVLVPLLLIPTVLVFAFKPFRAQLRSRFPTAWVRLLVYPVFFLLVPFILSISGRGWVAGASRLLAFKNVTIELDVQSVSRYEGRRTLCLQRLEVKRNAQVSTLCADPLIAKGQVSAGMRLVGLGIASPWGVHLQALQMP